MIEQLLGKLKSPIWPSRQWSTMSRSSVLLGVGNFFKRINCFRRFEVQWFDRAFFCSFSFPLRSCFRRAFLGPDCDPRRGHRLNLIVVKAISVRQSLALLWSRGLVLFTCTFFWAFLNCSLKVSDLLRAFC